MIQPPERLGVKAINLFVELGDFELGFEVDLVFDVAPDAVFFGLAALAEEDEDREDDRFQRDDHGEQAEGEGIEQRRLPARQPVDVEQDPDGEEEQVQVEKGEAAGEGGDPVGDFFDLGAAVLDLGVDVARGGVAQQVHRAPQPVAHRLDDVEAGLRVDTEELVQVFAVHRQRVEVFDGEDGGGAPAAVEEGDLAEDFAGSGVLQHDALAGVVLEEDLDAAGTDDVHDAARIVHLEDELAGRDGDLVDLPGEQLAFIVVEIFEERNSSEQRGIRRHDGSPGKSVAARL